MCTAEKDLEDYVNKINFNDQELLRDFLSRVNNNKPGALIRLGDGEAKLAGFPEDIDEDTLNRQLEIWFGERRFTARDIDDMREDLIRAIKSCSHLCLPTSMRTFAKNTNGDFTKDAKNCQALWRFLKNESLISQDRTIGTAVIHKHAQHTKWFAELFRKKRHFVFITRSASAVNNIVSAFKINDFEAHIIPGETWSRKGPTSDHFPERYHEVKSFLKGLPRGAVGIVGGGVLAKSYCCDIQEAGGIAFDCGALLDAWAGDIPKERQRNIEGDSKMTLGHLTS